METPQKEITSRAFNGRQPDEEWSEILAVTPDQARYWLNEARCPYQRGVRRHHVAALSNAMKTGNFAREGLVFYRLDERLYLVDGQHRLEAIIDSGETVRISVAFYLAKDEEEIQHAYRNIDRGIIRTQRDQARASSLPAELDLPAATVERYFSAVWLIARGFASSHGPWGNTFARDTDFKMRLVKRFAPQIALYEDAIRGRPTTLEGAFLRQPVMAVAIATLAGDKPTQAFEFWSTAAANDGLARNSPGRVLVDTLLMEKGKASSRETPHHVAKIIARCWNAYYDGRTLSWAKVGEPGTPILLRGTIYDGEQYLYLSPYTLQPANRPPRGQGDKPPSRSQRGRFSNDESRATP